MRIEGLRCRIGFMIGMLLGLVLFTLWWSVRPQQPDIVLVPMKPPHGAPSPTVPGGTP
ncbi:hypothetical protein [Streptosporangium roseum]|uniref:hypothetical protein n=1 Tax=Streptosporangium roseum TaxID=2001 RepID=UPI0033226D92